MRKPRRPEALRKLAAQILQKCGISRPPVPVDKVAEILGARVRYSPFEGELAGMLVRSNGSVIIGVNSLHHLNRQRFTIAHECGQPLVQGIRVCGRFFPPEWAGGASCRWVLIDGQGVGHEQASSNIHRTIPPELTKKYSGADVICLVDRAMPAMTGDAPILLEDLITRGFLDRLAIVFTHFEAVEAPDLDVGGRRSKVLEGLSTAIQGIDLPKAQKVLFERTAETKTHFRSRLDAREIKIKLTQGAVKEFCDRIKSSIERAPPPKLRPLFNEYQIADVLRAQIEEYRRDWGGSSLAAFNYKIMEALTNWIGNAYSGGYPK